MIRNVTQKSKRQIKLCATCQQEDDGDTEEVYTLGLSRLGYPKRL